MDESKEYRLFIGGFSNWEQVYAAAAHNEILIEKLQEIRQQVNSIAHFRHELHRFERANRERYNKQPVDTHRFLYEAIRQIYRVKTQKPVDDELSVLTKRMRLSPSSSSTGTKRRLEGGRSRRTRRQRRKN